MAFETLSGRLQDVANKSLAKLREKYGANGVKIDAGIHDSILWRPSFYLIQNNIRVLAVEVQDNLYPYSLKAAAHEISQYDKPILVFQACSLEAYLADPKQKKINNLKDDGFGIITVDTDGGVTIQHQCIPLAQHIRMEDLERRMKSLSKPIKIAFYSAYETYRTKEVQGLQEAGQIVEAMILCLVKCAVKGAILPATMLTANLAVCIDTLYHRTEFASHRAALGRARAFVGEYRNIASHPPKSAKKAAERIHQCKEGFLDAINNAERIMSICQSMNYKMSIKI